MLHFNLDPLKEYHMAFKQLLIEQDMWIQIHHFVAGVFRVSFGTFLFWQSCMRISSAMRMPQTNTMKLVSMPMSQGVCLPAWQTISVTALSVICVFPTFSFVFLLFLFCRCQLCFCLSLSLCVCFCIWFCLLAIVCDCKCTSFFFFSFFFSFSAFFVVKSYVCLYCCCCFLLFLFLLCCCHFMATATAVADWLVADWLVADWLVVDWLLTDCQIGWLLTGW